MSSSRHHRHHRARAPHALPAGAMERPIPPQQPFAPSQTTLQPYQVGTAALTQGLNVAGNNTIPVEAVADKTPVNLVFSPGDPIRPTPGMSDGTGAPRQWAYPVGSNISPQPRQTEATPFATLRALAALYEGIQLCEETYNRILDRLQLQIVPSPEALSPDDDPSAEKWRTPATAMRDWFAEGPDRRGTLDLNGWMKAAVKDIVEIDALGVYHRVTRGGGLAALELVAGDTIVCLEDTGGRTPLPPYPAYQQNLYGAPGVWLTSAELDYLRMTPRTNSLYGLSKVERIMLRINQALRKESFDMARFTDGATPMGIVSSSDPALVGKMTPEQLQQFEDMFNAVLAGNDAMRVRTKFLPPGYSFTSTRPDEIATDFDRYLLNVTTAGFGLTLDEIGFTETSNRSTGAAQENVVYRNAVKPLSDFLAAYLTRVIRRYDGTPLSPTAATYSLPGRATKSKSGTWDKRFCAQWGGIEEPEDFTAKVTAYSQLVNNGIVTRTQAKRDLKLPMTADEPQLPLIVTVQGGAQSIVDLTTWVEQAEKAAQASDAQLDAQIAGSQQTAKAFASGVAGPMAQANAAPQGQQQPPHEGQAGHEGAVGQQPSSQPSQPSQQPAKPLSGPAAAQAQLAQQNEMKDANTSQQQKEQSHAVGNPGQRSPDRRVPARRGVDADPVSGGWGERRAIGGSDSGDAVGAADGDADTTTRSGSERERERERERAGGSASSGTSSRTSAVGSLSSGSPSGEGRARQTEAATRSANGGGERASASGDSGSERDGQPDERAVVLELGRYRTKALNAVKAGKRAPRFESHVLPPGLHRDLEARLATCRSAEEVRAVFAGSAGAPQAAATTDHGDHGDHVTLGEPEIRSTTADTPAEHVAPADPWATVLRDLREQRALVLAALEY